VPDHLPSAFNSAQEEEKALFDEAFYLQRHPDIAAAVASGRQPSGWAHYALHGKRENRDARMGDFHPAFYAKAYPLARDEIAQGMAGSMIDHYRKIGRARGYLPNPQAERPDCPDSIPSRFGGLWFDAANGDDLIAGKEEVGLISKEQADQLRTFRRDGFVVLPGALSNDLCDRAADLIDRAYCGKLDGQLFECARVFGDFTPRPWQPGVSEANGKALAIHFLSSIARDVSFAPATGAFLKLAFESFGLASQTLGFLRGSAQEGHQDTAYVNYTRPRHFVASWAALEDVTVGAGELFYYVGSHNFEDFLFGGKHKIMHDCMRANGGKLPPGEAQEFVRSLERRAIEGNYRKEVFAAKKGDVLMWHSDLVHGGNPVSREITRKSIVTHYCPMRLAPLYFEGGKGRMYRHGEHYYTSRIYADREPGM
jgi:hypothetical protein